MDKRQRRMNFVMLRDSICCEVLEHRDKWKSKNISVVRALIIEEQVSRSLVAESEKKELPRATKEVKAPSASTDDEYSSRSSQIEYEESYEEV